MAKMTTETEVTKTIKEKFNINWNKFIKYMNSSKRPFNLGFFCNKYPDNNEDELIARYFFSDGFNEGARFLSQKIDEFESKAKKRNKE